MTAAQILREVLLALNFRFVMLTGLGTLIGLIVGALPGLTTTMGIAILTGITFKFAGVSAVALLIGLYVGGVYGGSISAILLSIPGTPASAATCLDGYPLARKGKAADAIFITRMASIIGTLFGMGCLAFFTPLLNRITLRFTSAEFFMLGLFGILISGTMTGTDHPIKGWIAGVFGVAIALIGADELYGYPRLAFGSRELVGGIPFIPIMIGFFGIPQVVDALKSEKPYVVATIERTRSKLMYVFRNVWWTLRAGLIGVGIGVIPGVGEDVAAWVAYGTAKKMSRHPEEFGKGSYEGLVACETANNSCIGGAIIPLLSLGIPGSPPAAVLLGALLLHGIRPGPMLSFEAPAFLYQVTAWLVVATFMMWILGILIARPVAKILEIRSSIVMPIVAVLCGIGAYALDLRMLDLVLVFGAGLLGYVFKEGKYPPAPIVLGVILGTLTDASFRRALQVSNGSPSIFFTRPVSLIFFLAIVMLITGQMGVWVKLASALRRPARLSG